MSDETSSQRIDLSEDIGLLSPQSIEALRGMFGCMVDCGLVGVGFIFLWNLTSRFRSVRT